MTRCILALLATLLLSTPALAQRDRLLVEPPPTVYWGLNFSLGPNWEAPEEFAELIGGAQEFKFKGTELTVGFARGRALGSDWGISLVWRKLDEGCFVDRTYYWQPVAAGTTYRQGDLYTIQDLSMIGPEFRLSFPFVTIKERVQLGMTIAGGATWMSGDVEQRTFDVVGNLPTVTQTETVKEADLKELFIDGTDWFPVGKAEFTFSVIVGSSFKVIGSSGFNYPGWQYFRIGAVYFFPREAP